MAKLVPTDVIDIDGISESGDWNLLLAGCMYLKVKAIMANIVLNTTEISNCFLNMPGWVKILGH